MNPLRPALCRSATQLPSGAAWLYEPKLDGFRVLAHRVGERVHVRGRNGGELSRNFAELAESLVAVLPDRSVIDGELVAATRDGRFDFEALMHRHGHGGQDTICYLAAFDLLALEGSDLTHHPLSDRRALLAAYGGRSDALRLVPQTDDRDAAEVWLTSFMDQGIEGVVAKRASGRYQPGRRDWVKVKGTHTVECVVGGWRGSDGPEVLLLGAPTPDGLRFLGQTTRLSPTDRRRASDMLRPGPSAFVGRAPGRSRWENHRFEPDEWVPSVPNTVVEVACSAAGFRHAVRFVRWRPDRCVPSAEVMHPMVGARSLRPSSS
jgi:ATP-dependent DNA ligase